MMSGDGGGQVGSAVTDLDPHIIKENPYQPRRTNERQPQQELVESIREGGIHEPLIVRVLESGDYQLVAGSRRLSAALELGLRLVPVVVRNYSDNEAEAVALVENLQRASLRFDDEAVALLKLQARYELSSSAIARTIGKSADYVDIRLAAARHPDVLEMYLAGAIAMADILPTIRSRKRGASGTPNYSEFTTELLGSEEGQAKAASRSRRPHSGYRAFNNAVTMFLRLAEVRERMDDKERIEARDYALKVREAADRFLDLMHEGK